ncbi:hypothetical protein CDO52_07445 [Nocardiopsis gilva YIM 90087]|uniref:Uncharacterized protein n=1 Tax=Nocardiopsis gilva YIM 90087 TaxID=1235441 RepID=A0A223S3D3_9ACTN|nr:hypothetical protein [Nocardiopsis gilva]ASU82640.1 hypothetical protein CDO52_07445 [Nocardiopsis gilva YIM 90087]
MGTLSWINGSSPATPAQAIDQLRGYLAAETMERLYAGDRGAVASLSIRTGLTVWCMGGLFRWCDDLGAQQTHTAADPEGAARRIVALSEPRTVRSAA